MERIRQTKTKGFTLLELLSVITIAAVLTALLVPGMGQIAASTRLSKDGNLIVDEINNARALALARNMPVEVWFLELPGTSEGQSAWRAVRSRLLEADGGTTWVSRTRSLSENIALASTATFSNCIGGQTPQFLEELPGGIQGTGVRFYPGGRAEAIRPLASLSLNDPLFVTIAPEHELGNEDQAPRNFVTIQIEPRNGRVTSFRP